MYTQQFFIEGLGCASYIVGCEAEGVAAVFDPDRDVKKYLDAADARGLKITHIIETHLHADHVSVPVHGGGVPRFSGSRLE